MLTFNVIITISLLFFTGCATPDGTDPLATCYEAYQGTQTNWPTAPATFVTDLYGINFYHGLPNFQYSVVGRYNRPNLPLEKIAASARVHNTDTVVLSSFDITTQHTDPEQTRHYGTRNFFTTESTGGDTYATTKTFTTAYLIRPLSSATNYIAPTPFVPLSQQTIKSPRGKTNQPLK